MSTFQLTAAKPADVQISNDGKTIYTSSDDGYIRAYSTQTGVISRVWHVGTDLGAMDLSPDGSFIMVAEDQPVSSPPGNSYLNGSYVVAVDKLDLSTGLVTSFRYTTNTSTFSNPSEYTFFDVAVLSNNRVLLTEYNAPGVYGWTTPKLLDLATGVFSTAVTATYSPVVDHTILSPGDDGARVFYGETNISDARVDIYTAATGQLVSHNNYQDGVQGYDHGAVAYSAAAGLGVEAMASQVFVFDNDAHLVKTLTPGTAGAGFAAAAFDAAGANLFLFDIANRVILDVSTSSWTVVQTIAVPYTGSADWTSGPTDFGSRLVVDPHGQFLALTTDTGVQLIDNPAAPPISGTEGDDYEIDGTVVDDTINALGGSDFVDAGAGNDIVHLGTGDDSAFGGAGNDQIYGDAGDDYLLGEDGNDQLYGGDGNDYMRGGAGTDSYDGGNDTGPNASTLVGDQVSFFDPAATQGAVADLRTGIVSNDGFGNVETLTGVESLGAGTAYADTFYGNDNANGLSGEKGDNLYGFGGDDFFSIRAATAVLDGGAGTDTLILSALGRFYLPGPGGPGFVTLAPAMLQGWTVDLGAGFLRDGYNNVGSVAGIENVTGSEKGDNIQGDAGANLLEGAGGDDILTGNAGADTLNGGDGDDILNSGLYGDPFAGASPVYVFPDNGSDVDTLNGGAGNDTISAGYGDHIDGGSGLDSLNLSLAAAPAGVTVDFSAYVSGGSFNIGPTTILGIESLSVIGTASNDVLDAHAAGAGVTALMGGGGDDILKGGSDTVYMAGGSGDDTIDGTAVTYAYQTATFFGDAGNDLLIGGHGRQTLNGGTGNDVYRVFDSRVTVVENSGEGTDEVQTTLSGYTLPGNVENLVGLLDSGQFLNGNDLANVITGGAGNDYINGLGGADTMVGGKGDDVYYVLDAGDVVTELAGEGRDEVRTDLATYTLAANVEWMFGIRDTGQSLTGNDLDNFIWGGVGNDVLDGGAGADTLDGGWGDDVYYVDNSLDRVMEDAGQGIDEIRTALTDYTLASNVENLVQLGTAFSRLAGNSGDNIVTTGSGGARVNLASGGHDSVHGGAGDDIVDFGAALDALDRVDGGGGSNSVTLLGNYSGLTLAPLLTNVGSITLMSLDTGFHDVGIGGQASYDLAAGDLIAPGGHFTVDASELTSAETVRFDGSAAGQVAFTMLGGGGSDSLTGGALADALSGGGGNDVLDGGAGADTMAGGAGNDIYYVDNANDVVVELAGEGFDEVRTTIATYSLPANIEKLTYVGTGNFTFTGSGGDDNVAGAGGNDYFDLSQGGADTASGGAGNDAFSFGAAFGAGDSVDGGAGADTVGIRGDYTGAGKLTISAGQLTGVETLSLMTGGGAGYDIVWQDGNLGTGEKIVLYAGNLAAGENVTFDGSAETHGYFVYYGGAGIDIVKGSAASDGFYFGPGKFDQNDHVDGGGGGRNQLGLDGSYDFSAGSALGTLGGNFTNIQTIVLYRGTPGDPNAPYPNTYHIETNDAAVAAGQTLTIYATPVASDLFFDGLAETDGAFQILSGSGDDTIRGGQGNDTIFGNLGADLIAGGGGNDVFLYTDTAQSNGAKYDRIVDFSSGDRIDLSQIDADILQAGHQGFTWLGSGGFTNHAGELRAEGANGFWTIQADTDGDGQADLVILLNTPDNHPITSADFIL